MLALSLNVICDVITLFAWRCGKINNEKEKENWRLVNLNNEAVCKLCFPSMCQDKKFSKEVVLRSFETKVITSHGRYKHIWLVELV